MQNQFTRFDTKLKDGVYVTLNMATEYDYTASPSCDESIDAARLQAWTDDKWHYIGVRCRAEISVASSGAGTSYHLVSAGCWGVESDAGDYLNEAYAEERDAMIAQIGLLRTLPLTVVTPEALASACDA